jgi:hypothetical protein
MNIKDEFWDYNASPLHIYNLTRPMPKRGKIGKISDCKTARRRIPNTMTVTWLSSIHFVSVVLINNDIMSFLSIVTPNATKKRLAIQQHIHMATV